ncbi:MAG TPA: Bax inhibitor-1/YccA family protein [Acidimicrobiia bacterium]|nr:Bax inhibitor-1/YccA family protein [Acidimicrobiia bacterium]
MSNPVLTKQFGPPAGARAATAGADVTMTTGAEMPPIVDTGDRMTMSSVLKQTGLLFLLLMGGALYGWRNIEDFGSLFWISMIAAVALLIVTMVKKKWVKVTGPLYAIAEGVLVGGISAIYNDAWNGIVVQAVLATAAVFIAMLFLYANRIIKVTDRLRSTIMLATAGIFLFYLISIVLSLLGVDIPFVWDGGPFSILFSALICGVAAFNLLLDFDIIERGVTEGAPAWMSWFAAFGLMVTVVWLYLEILRLLALTRD